MKDARDLHVTRREFLRNTACGAAATGIGALAVSAFGVEKPPEKATKPLLPHGVLGRTKYPVTRVSFGAIRISEKQGTRILKAAIDRGINLVHTSKSYVNGRSIVAVGDLFKADKGYRDKVFLCLKSYTPEKEAEVDEMLTILGTDHVDGLFTELHKPDPRRLEAIQKQQDDLKKKGKLRHTGFVCHGDMTGVMAMVLEKAPAYFDATLLSLAPVGGGRGRQRGPEQKSEAFLRNLQAMRKNGVGILSMKSGAQSAVEKGVSVFQPHVKAMLEAGADSVLTSINSLEQVETVKALDLKDIRPSAAEKHAAAEFFDGRSGACLMCAECAKACPNGVPVNDLMRVRMYHEEYGWPDHARSEFRALGERVAALTARCGDCTACAAACPVKLANAANVRRIAAMFA
ncbi:MAG: aldo/keto reductase [Phycisphaerae bacterium]